MPNYQATIDILVRANDLDVIRTVSAIPTGQTITDAWLQVNAIPPPAATSLFQKHITSTLVAGQGQIEDTGAGDGVAVIRFEITNVNSALCTGGTFVAPANHPYGIEVKSSGLKTYEFEQGMLPVIEQIVIPV